MKMDRLLSIIVYLLNHDLARARDLAERFGVTVRTIQRDMQTIEQAGIPIFSLQGSGGGYGIMDSYKLDRRLMSMEDFYHIITSLESVGSSLSDGKMDGTLEKIKSLMPKRGKDLISERNEKLSIDFRALGGDPRQKATYQIVEQAVENEWLLQFSYTSNKLETSERLVEPMTIAFRWRSWYLFGYCRLREDFRIFRISRIKNPKILPTHFRRRTKTLDQMIGGGEGNAKQKTTRLVLQFDPMMRPLVEEWHDVNNCIEGPDGSLVVTLDMPEDGWLYGYILSFGQFVEVLEPIHIRNHIREAAAKIISLYQ